LNYLKLLNLRLGLKGNDSILCNIFYYVQFSINDIFNRFFFASKLKTRRLNNSQNLTNDKYNPNYSSPSYINFSNKKYCTEYYHSPLNLILNLKVLNNSISRLNNTQVKITNFLNSTSNPILHTTNFTNLLYYSSANPTQDIFINNLKPKNRLNFTLSESSLLSHNLLSHDNLNITKQQSSVSLKSLRNIHEYSRSSTNIAKSKPVPLIHMDLNLLNSVQIGKELR
jgi:hypothetical protein